MASLKEIIDYSKANPNTDYATHAFEKIQSGVWDEKAIEEEIDLSSRPFGRVATKIEPSLETLDIEGDESFLGGIGKDLLQRREKVTDIKTRFEEDKLGPIRAGFLGAGQIAGSIADVLGNIIGAGIDKLPEDTLSKIGIGGKPGEVQPLNIQQLIDSPVGEKAKEALVAGGEKFEEFEKENPEFTELIRAGINIADLVTLGVISSGAKKTGKELIETGVKTAKELAEKAAEKGTKLVGDIAERRGGVKLGKELTTIEETISPSLTAKEVRKASAEGRIERGKTGGFREKLFGEKDDVIRQTDSVKQASDTIQERIPGASKMNDQQLNKSLIDEVGKISEDIKPDMKAVQISTDKTDEAFSIWEKLKKTQAADQGDFISFNGAQMQKRFEAFLNQTKQKVRGEGGQFRQKDLNDLWDIRKEYDNSIPDRIKQANDLSDSRLQFQKETWLDNRAILNDMINDTADGLGDISKGAFSDMTDLYIARQNIISKTKIAKAREGIITTKNLKRLGMIWIGGSILQSVTGIDVPGI